MNKLSPLSLCLSLISTILFASLFSCSKAKDTTTKLSTVSASKSSSIFLKGTVATQDESYSHIVNNVARLKAMLTGTFVQYNTVADTLGKKYSAWLVNDGKDSVVLYQIPAGNHQKIGHWIFQYQIMTSLPDNPVRKTFSKLVEISRDSIEEQYFSAPSDFDVPLEELLKNPEAAFEKVNFSTLKPALNPDKTCHVRKTPLHFVSESLFLPDSNPLNKDGLRVDCYEITPSKIVFRMKHFTIDKQLRGYGMPQHFMKLAMMKSDAAK